MPENKKTIRILCVDDDKDFIQYLLNSASSFNAIVETSISMASAREKLKEKSYDAFIVDLKLPDGSGFDLVKEIRRVSPSPIAVVSGAYKDEKSYRTLKEEENIDFVLDKPVYPKQIEDLLSRFCGQAPEDAPEKEDKLTLLKRNYQKTINDKIELISQQVYKVQKNPSMEALTELKAIIHKIGGSAGSYGYPEVSSASKNLEVEIKNLLDAGVAPTSSWIARLDHFLHDIKYYFQVPQEFDSGATGKAAQLSGVRDSLYLIDYNKNFLTLLERENQNFSIPMSYETDPFRGFEKLKSENFNPRVVVLSSSYPDLEKDTYELINELRNSPNYLPTIFCIIQDEIQIEDRIKAANQDIKYLFRRPTSPLTVLDCVSEILEAEKLQNFRVLVLDDDDEACHFIDASLSEVGFDVRTIQTPAKLYPTMEKFVPHVLILDVLLPEYDGLELLKTLRSDPHYRNMVIIIITHWKDILVEKKAFSEQVDEVFFKPLDKTLLQKRVIDFTRRLAMSGKTYPFKNITGLHSLPMLASRVQENIVYQHKTSSCLVYFEIDRLTDYILQKGRKIAYDLFVPISNLLISHLNENTSGYFIEPFRFAILFEEQKASEVESKVNRLLQLALNEVDSDYTFSCAIVPLSKQFRAASEVFQAGETLLASVRKQEVDTPIKIGVLEEEEVRLQKKEVMLIDPDQQLLNLLEAAFEPYGIKITKYFTGEKALSDLLSRKEGQLPSLIISERKFPDLEGLQLLDGMKKRFRKPPPFFFLTLYSSDEDIRTGLQHGATEYLTKPFNLSIVVQKAIHEIYEHAYPLG